MNTLLKSMKAPFNRRSFMKSGLTAAGVATVGAGVLSHTSTVLANGGSEERSCHLDRGDAAILRFLAAA